MDENAVEVTKSKYAVKCLICDNVVPILDARDDHPRICDECKAAMKISKITSSLEKKKKRSRGKACFGRCTIGWMEFYGISLH